MIVVDRVTKVYSRGENRVEALRGVSLRVERGEFLSIMGPSGSGKSTLLHLIGGLDSPTEGDVFVDGRSLAGLSDDELTAMRLRNIGFVFQFFNLLPTLTVEENVGLPLLLDGRGGRERRAAVARILERVGMTHRIEHRSYNLSGGEMQRVAIARALVMSPAVVIADEPTGALDSKTGDEVLRLLRDATTENDQTVVMVTHNPRASEHGDRTVTLRDGMLTDEVLDAAGAVAGRGAGASEDADSTRGGRGA